MSNFSDGGSLESVKVSNFSDGGSLESVKVSNFSDGGSLEGVKVSNFSDGGDIADISNFSNGGSLEGVKINNYASGGVIGGMFSNLLSLGYGVKKAMKREGSGAVPIVANNRERVLNPSDTLVFNELLASGEWKRIRESKVANFSSGGLISPSNVFNTNANKSNTNSNNTNTNTNTNRNNNNNRQTVYHSTNINVYAKDADSFRKSKTQIAYEQNLIDKRRRYFS